MENIFKNRVVLITGGTGSFGKKFSEIMLKEYRPKKLIIYSRDEMKQFEMQAMYEKFKNIRFTISSDDARHTIELDDYYVIEPDFNWWDKSRYANGKLVKKDFYYSSDTNRQWLSIPQIRKLIEQ